MQYLSAAMATIAIVLMFTAAHATEPSQAQQTFEERLIQTADALELTDEQRLAFSSTLAQRAAAQRDVLTRYGIDPENATEGLAQLGPGDRRKLRKDMQALRAETTDALAGILDAEQLETFKELEAARLAAQRAEIRDRMRGRF